MPELPEVETVRRGLSELLVGLTVADVAYDNVKSFPNMLEDVRAFLISAQITEVRRRAKVLIIELSSEYALVVHLKMTGQLIYRGEGIRFGAGHPTDSLVGELPDRSTRVVITFTNGARLFFNDQRKFGWMRLMPSVEVPNIDFMQKVGPEPLEADFTWQLMRDRLQRRKNSNIKAALLDQTVIAGVGNIYTDESLWGAYIHPLTLVRHLADEDFQKLHKSLTDVLILGIEKGGSTDKNYVNAEGKRGSYLTFANVFRREGQTCPRHPDTVIQKTRVAGRGTHVCPKCQKITT